MNFKKIDIENWVRKEHYRYYTEKLKIEVNMTAPIDVKNLLDFCYIHNYKFYPTVIYIVTKVLNKIENFKMFRDNKGNLCVWDKINPNYTIFHQDDKTFSDCWSEYEEDFEKCFQNITTDMHTYKDKKGIKVKEQQPANFYCISCTPWTAFTGYGSRVANGEPAFSPIITMGKYEKNGNRIDMPVNITIVADGYHIGLFFEYLQNEINALKN